LPAGGSWFVWNKRTTEELKKAIGNTFELCWSKQPHKREIINYTWAGALGMKKDDGNRIHPTQKPVGLCGSFLSKFSKDAARILDPFLGSGTTLIACEQLDRICYGMEISPQYCEVICQRWEKLTGDERLKINGVDATT